MWRYWEVKEKHGIFLVEMGKLRELLEKGRKLEMTLLCKIKKRQEIKTIFSKSEIEDGLS